MMGFWLGLWLGAWQVQCGWEKNTSASNSAILWVQVQAGASEVDSHPGEPEVELVDLEDGDVLDRHKQVRQSSSLIWQGSQPTFQSLYQWIFRFVIASVKGQNPKVARVMVQWGGQPMFCEPRWGGLKPLPSRPARPRLPGLWPFLDDEWQDLMQRLFQDLEPSTEPEPEGPQGPEPSPWGNQPPTNQSPSVWQKTPSDDLAFVDFEVNPLKVYVTQGIFIKWWLFVRGYLRQIHRVQFPKMEGFWKETLQEISNLQFEPIWLHQQLWRRALLGKHVYFALKPGPFTIDNYQMDVQVETTTSFGASTRLTVTGPTLNIQVLPLPPLPKPAHNEPIVGSFELEWQTPTSLKVKVGEPFELILKVSGWGNAKLLAWPENVWPDAIQVLNQQHTGRFFENGTSVKDFHWYLKVKDPAPPEKIQIPSLTWAFWNEKIQEYEYKITPPVEIEVLPSAELGSQSQHNIPVDQLNVWVSPQWRAFWDRWGYKGYGLGSWFWWVAGFVNVAGWGYVLANIRRLVGRGWRVQRVWMAFRQELQKKPEDPKNWAQTALLFFEKWLPLLSQFQGRGSDFDSLWAGLPPGFRLKWGARLRSWYDQLERWAWSQQPPKPSEWERAQKEFIQMVDQCVEDWISGLPKGFWGQRWIVSWKRSLSGGS